MENRGAKNGKIIKAAIWVCVIIISMAYVFEGCGIHRLRSWLIFVLPCAALIIYAVVKFKADRKRLYCTAGSALAMAATYLVWTNVSINDSQVSIWAIQNMYLAAAFAVVTGAFFAKYIFALAVFTSFNIGIAAGDIFGVYSFDPGGGLLHNGWIILFIIFFGASFAAAIAQLIYGKIKRAKDR